MSEARASIVALVAATGAGKSHWIKTKGIDQGGCVVVWDPMHEYGKLGRTFDSLAKLTGAIRARPAGVFVYQVPRHVREDEKKMQAAFAFFCHAVYEIGDVTVIVEELSLVTKAGYAPPKWRELIVTGRHRRLRVIGTTQRPALCDKTFISNATLLRVGFLRAASDKAAMSDVTDVPVAELRALRKFEWIEVNDNGEKRVERLPSKTPAKRPRGAA